MGPSPFVLKSLCGLSAGVEAPLEHLNRSIQPSRDIRSGDVEALCRLLRGKTLI